VVDTQSISSEYTTATTFGLKLRFMLACKNSTGTATERAFVTAVLVVRLRT